MNESYLRVLGSADWHQTAFNDHSCYTVSDKILVDACPSVVTQLLERGVDPIDIHTLCFTHMHADHFMGLAPLLHYWRVCRGGDLSGLTIVGPEATVRKTVLETLSWLFLSEGELSKNVSRLPEIVELSKDASFDTPEYALRAMDSDHAVPGLCYVMTRKRDGHSVGFTGDSAYQPAFGAFFHGVDLLVHEASYGVERLENKPNLSGHSSAYEAVRVCREAQVKRLLLTHAYEPKREAVLALAREQLPIAVDWAMPHNVFGF